MTPILIVPGRGNSEPGHWQSIIEAQLPAVHRVQQDDWASPSLATWSRAIDLAVRELDHPLVVAHSFGCLATAHAQITLGTPVGATLFVAPADPQRFDLPYWLFAEPLAQPGIVIASDDDPWLSLKKAQMLAADWGVRCINLGPAGHINVASGHGQWPLGNTVIKSMRAELDNRARRARPSLGHNPEPQIWELGHGTPRRRAEARPIDGFRHM